MELSQQEKQLIRDSFAKLAGRKQQAGEIFYERLFSKDPSLRAMFHRAPIETQATKLMQVLDWVVERLDRVPELKAELTALGEKHAEFGVKVDHYPLVGSALVWTLKNTLGPEFSPEAEEAWIELYTYLSNQMEP
ncbi:MAG: globin domain-containing protein [Chloroflexia bacterium]